MEAGKKPNCLNGECGYVDWKSYWDQQVQFRMALLNVVNLPVFHYCLSFCLISDVQSCAS